ncbi:SOS response-associated peptidase [Kitasatospora atroaurantiaca]|uniref:Abasic site processing protein n=1 Tax=Kitasatospora atroaurantiaca TaxID=285545 RepID=A0A561F1T6_9ACTN|nr:SOS response-associated peptidase [Kitasatospora atroaurantiaca]TWE21835.1 putative SOS response-associated peptidase YedK [Kitasatospora atroaurantiaca]
MCGRFVSTSNVQDLVELFGVTRWSPTETLAPSWNVAPTDTVWAVMERVDRETGELARQLRPLRWGLVPSWAKDPGVGARMINARAETVHEKPAFRKAFSSRRCLLPADGYYEWVAIPAAEGKKGFKQPYYITPSQGDLLVMAGLYEFWRDHTRPEDDPLAWLTTTTIITTQATDAAGRVHDRMPLAIDPDDFEAWLDPEHHDPGELRQLLHTPAGGDLTVRAVSTAVNSVRNNGAQLLDEVPDPGHPASGDGS